MVDFDVQKTLGLVKTRQALDAIAEDVRAKGGRLLAQDDSLEAIDGVHLQLLSQRVAGKGSISHKLDLRQSQAFLRAKRLHTDAQKANHKLRKEKNDFHIEKQDCCKISAPHESDE